MMYCKRCRVVFDLPRCPVCGSKKVRLPESEDPCFLVEKEEIWSGMLSDVLSQNNISFLKESTLGAALALSVGPLFERFRFYVEYKKLPEAEKLVEELFGENEIL